MLENPTTKYETRSTKDSKLRLLIYVLIFAISIAAAFVSYLNFLTTTRGVSYLPPEASRSPMKFGVNADLDQYNDADLERALGMIRDAKITLVRQHFYWKDIEQQKGQYDWGKWDRIVAGTKQNGLDLVAVIDTTPVWARDLGEADLPNAAPKYPEDYAQFVAAFAQRYASVRLIQIWDNPNVHPFWGRRIVDPIEYTALLRAAATSARAANPNVRILSAGLAPNSDLIRGHADYSDVLFLRGMYDAGARDYFDILGAKPYGMWSGPEDRRVDKDVVNFSRAIVLRDEMVAHGDVSKPMWAVEFGWNASPPPLLIPSSGTGGGTRGAPSPWGSDTEAVQSARLFDAVQRAKSEWAWMSAMIVQTFQPNASSDDSIWGFALVDRNFQPRDSYAALTRAMTTYVAPAAFNAELFFGALLMLAIVVGVSVWRGIIVARQISWGDYWRMAESCFVKLPQFAKYIIPITAVAAFYVSHNTFLNFALLSLIILLFALRLDLGLAITVFTIPFYLQTKNLIGGTQFSLVELLTIACTIAFAVRRVLGGERKTPSDKLKVRRNWLDTLRSSLSASDYAVLFFVFAGLLSVKIAANFGVANREFRVIVFEPAVMYALIRVSDLEIKGIRRLVDALLLSALAISVLGLYQFFFSNYVIIGEGVRRILSVYGSPNNLALYLDRVLPMLTALIVFNPGRLKVATTTAPSPPSQTQPEPTKVGFAYWLRRHLHCTKRSAVQVFQSPRVLYALAAIPIALCLYLTYSRAALLFALPAGFIVVALASGRRVRIGLGALFIVGLIALVPFTQTERWQSLFQEGTGTGFFRVSVWQSAWEMIRDHPIFGVGLDNFLYEYPKYIKPDAWREPNLSHPHNIVLDFWTRMGIPGLIALGWMVVVFFREGVRGTARVAPTRGIAIVLMAGMVAAIAHGIMDAAYFFVDLAFVWMLMLGVMAQIADRK